MNMFKGLCCSCIIALLFISATVVQAQVNVTDWGSSGYAAWPILNDGNTPAGNAGMGDGSPTSGWSSIRGGFDQVYQVSTEQAVVVTGQMKLTGGGGVSAYTPLRFSLTYQDSVKLQYQNTDSAAWVAVDTTVTSTNHDGYLLCPMSGLGTMSNTWRTGAQGTIWTVPAGNWVSTNNLGAIALAAIKQAPRNAEMIAGTYDFAISVQDMGDGSNEVRWYMVEVGNKYWFGGTVIDTSQVSDKFNGIVFGVNSDNEATQFDVYAVQVGMGDPVVVPEAPWEPFYVNEWGSSGYAAWPVLNDTTYLDGDAAMGDGSATTGWSSIKGGFGDPVALPEGKALIVSGQMKLTGGGGASAYTPLRFSLTYQDSVKLQHQYTDSAAWVAMDTTVTSTNHDGYLLCPMSGLGTMSNTWRTGAQGTIWTVPAGNWVSTNNVGADALAAIKQAPRNAEMIAGTYDFAISVQDMGDGTNEVRWYMVEVNNKYWFGGTVIDEAQVSDKFNSIIFGVNSDNEATQFDVYAVQVDLGDPITVPEAPWEPFYVTDWGSSGYAAWPVLNDTTYLDGDAAMGDGSATTGWSSIKGGFGDPVALPEGKALIVSGQMKLTGGGGGNGYTPLRYSLTYQDSVKLQHQYTDSAAWVAVDTTVTSTNHDGYLLCPMSGLGTMSNTWRTGAQGTIWTVPAGNWVSTNNVGAAALAPIKQAPRNAEMIAGTYDFAISVQDMGDGTNEVRWYMVEVNNKYWFGGTVIDTSQVSDKFNGIVFGVNSDNEATQFDVYAVQVDLGDPITVPEAPWEPFYVTDWGSSGYAAWPVLNDTTYLDGDAAMGDGSPTTGWSSIKGGFGDPVALPAGKALIVSGQMKLTGGGGGNGYTPLRYSLTYQDSVKLQHQYTDSAAWVAVDTTVTSTNHDGYLFCPMSGLGTMSNTWRTGAQGTAWTVPAGNWVSTNNVNAVALAPIKQAPRNAEMIAGTYNFAISVQDMGDGTNEVRWYMVEVENKYWFGGTVIDSSHVSDKFNGIVFGVNNDNAATQFDVYAVQVDLGDPITVPKAPWEDFYVDTWGIYGGNNGGWTLSAGEFDGDVNFNGTAAPTGWAVVRGGWDAVTPEPDVDILVVKGNIVLEGGGFEGSASLRFGLFNGDAGTVAVDSALDSSNVWTGSDDNNTGYLMIAQEGSNNEVTWGTGSGNWGEITDDVWHNYAGGVALGNMAPQQTSGGADTYQFAICVKPMSDGTSKIIWTLKKANSTYYMEGGAIDDSPVAAFNSIVVGINNGATATSMLLQEVQVTMAAEEIPNAVQSFESLIPVRYALNQNYPNPFNPSTTIEYALPKNGEVSLKVFDISGRLVSELVKGTQNAGFHKIMYDASHLSTGIYFFTLKAEGFVDVKKMILIK